MDEQWRIFKYDDGNGPVYADPSVVHHKLHTATDGKLVELLEQAAGEGEAAGPATVKLIEVSRQAFELVLLSRATGAGATDEDALGVLRSFLDWLQARAEARAKAADPEGKLTASAGATKTTESACEH